MRRLLFKNFKIIDKTSNFFGSIVAEDGKIKKIIQGKFSGGGMADSDKENFSRIIDGNSFSGVPVLMPAFVDLHAHYRDAGGEPLPRRTSDPQGLAENAGIYDTGVSVIPETIESGSLAAVTGGYVTVICMANTKPVIDTTEKACNVKARSDAVGLIDLFPVVSLTKNMDGRELTEIESLNASGGEPRPSGSAGNSCQAQYLTLPLPLMLSEDGKDIADEKIFFSAMQQARRLGLPVSCHCDFGGPEAQAAKAMGKTRAEWSRIEENNAVRRAIELGKAAGCHIHIAHVSTGEAVSIIQQEKKLLGQKSSGQNSGFKLTCEATPHHIGATEEDARRMGEESRGRVNPPLRTEADRNAVRAALLDGTIDAIATDHAPHSDADKAAGSPGFSGQETAFAACLSYLFPDDNLQNNDNNKSIHDKNKTIAGNNLQKLSAMMSANPAAIIGLDTGPEGRGSITADLRADFVIIDPCAEYSVDSAKFKSRGKCSPFNGQKLRGKILMTVNKGRIVYDGDTDA